MNLFLRSSLPANEAPKQKKYFTVYLPSSYNDEPICIALRNLKGYRFDVFTPYARESYRDGNVWVRPMQLRSMERSMRKSAGVITALDAETIGHAIGLDKPILVLGDMWGKGMNERDREHVIEVGIPIVERVDRNLPARIAAWIREDITCKVSLGNN